MGLYDIVNLYHKKMDCTIFRYERFGIVPTNDCRTVYNLHVILRAFNPSIFKKEDVVKYDAFFSKHWNNIK